MGLPKLASAGSVVKIWSDLSLVQQLTPADADDHVSSISWSPNGQYIVSSCAKGDRIVVTNTDCPTRYVTLTPKEENNFVSYSSTRNCYLLSCGKSSFVCVWDLQTQSIRKNLKTSFKGVDITCAAFDGRDSCVACGMRNGAVQIINMMTTVAHSPIINSDVQSINAIRFAPLKSKQPYWFGTSSDDGYCNLWDGNINKRIHHFENGHSAPATGFSFSPANESMMVSVGLDKAVQFYDSRSFRKLGLKIVAKEPLSCLDFTNDGQYIAVGSTKGSVYLYDLRVANTTFGIIPNAHKEAVKAVFFKTVSKAEDDFTIDITMRQHSSNQSDKNVSDKSSVSRSRWQVKNNSNDNSGTSLNKTVQSTYNLNSEFNNNVTLRTSTLSISENSGSIHLPQKQADLTSVISVNSTIKNNTTMSKVRKLNGQEDNFTNKSCDFDHSQTFESSSNSLAHNEASFTETNTNLPDELKTDDLSCVRDVVREELREFQKSVDERIHQLHIFCIRQFINCENSFEECVKKMDKLDLKLSAVANELKYRRDSE